MVQRIQTLWFLAALATLGFTFIFALYHSPSVKDFPNFYLGETVIGIITTAVSMLLTFYTLILYKNRKKQITFSWFAIIATLGNFGYLYVACQNYIEKYQIVGGNYWFGLFMPLIALVFIFLGLMGVKKDEKLIKSLDRLR